MKISGNILFQSNILCIINNLHHGFMGVISMLKGSKSQKNVKNHDFPIFPIAACANFQEGSEKDSCPMWKDGEFFSHTLYSLWKLCAKF